MFAAAMRQRDLEGVLRTLTLRRREGLARQIEGFLAGLDRKVDDKLQEIAADRAELRWDEQGQLQFRIVLLREDGEWRIDDIHILPSTADGSEPDADAAPAADEIFNP